MKCVQNIVYQTQHNLALNLYVPDSLSAAACVIYAHGGGFRNGSKADLEVTHFAKRLTDRGFAMAAIDYRLKGQIEDVSIVEAASIVTSQERSKKVGLTLSETLFGSEFYTALEDVSSAVAFLKAEAPSLGFVSNKVGILGLSAGGIAALSTVFSPRNMETYMTAPDAVVTIAAALVQPWRMRADGAPCLLINSAHDRIIGIENARLGLTRAKAIGAPFQLVETAVSGHMTQVDVVLDRVTRDGTPYFDLITSHFEVLRAV